VFETCDQRLEKGVRLILGFFCGDWWRGLGASAVVLAVRVAE
jgi:hypothetical protein